MHRNEGLSTNENRCDEFLDAPVLEVLVIRTGQRTLLKGWSHCDHWDVIISSQIELELKEARVVA